IVRPLPEVSPPPPPPEAGWLAAPPWLLHAASAADAAATTASTRKILRERSIFIDLFLSPGSRPGGGLRCPARWCPVTSARCPGRPAGVVLGPVTARRLRRDGIDTLG